MIGNHYHVGIAITYGYAGSGNYGWSGEASFVDAGFCSDNAATSSVSTEGVLRTRYFVKDAAGVSGAEAVINTLLHDLGLFGIRVASDFNKVIIVKIAKDYRDTLEVSEADMTAINKAAASVGYEVFVSTED